MPTEASPNAQRLVGRDMSASRFLAFGRFPSLKQSESNVPRYFHASPPPPLRLVSRSEHRCASCPRHVGIIYSGYILSLLFLFAHFYVSSYTKKVTGSDNHANGAKTHTSNASEIHTSNGSTIHTSNGSKIHTSNGSMPHKAE